MTTEEANQLLVLAKANYGYAFKNMSDQEKFMLVKSWAIVLADVPLDIVTMAFMQLLSVSKWLPTVAELRDQVKKMYFSAAAYTLEYGSGNQQEDAARSYIMQHTSHLRGEGPAELTLDAMLSRGYAQELGCKQEKLQTGNRYITEG